MILAGFLGELGRGRGGGGGRRGGGGFHRVRPGSYYPVVYPTAEYVTPEVYVVPIPLPPAPCSTRPNLIPPCVGGRLVWRDANTVCCTKG
jgi:hypothetical protein